MKRCSCKPVLGRVHSFESFGTHEGPGIRYLIFLQGCLARCLYCQNPDTWGLEEGKAFTPQEVFARIKKCLPYLTASKGGVTVSGGEPLLQPDFLISLFKLCRKRSIHTAVDTSAFYPAHTPRKKINTLIQLTGLFIVDIKAIEERLHKKLTSRVLKEPLSFIAMLERKKRPYWLRYVLVPGINDSKIELKKLKDFIFNLKYCQKFEFLPYHTLGRHKWECLGLRYPLKRVRPATVEDIDRAGREITRTPGRKVAKTQVTRKCKA
ncbi:MAG: pyruvate formate-lyase-activating protein [Candidatus Omnitrophota bacterium]